MCLPRKACVVSQIPVCDASSGVRGRLEFDAGPNNDHHDNNHTKYICIHMYVYIYIYNIYIYSHTNNVSSIGAFDGFITS